MGPHREFLPTVALICFGLAGLMGGIGKYKKCRTNKAYEIAQTYATQRFGDKKAPLTETEESEWYNVMKVREGKEPSYAKLKDYIKFEDYSIRVQGKSSGLENSD